MGDRSTLSRQGQRRAERTLPPAGAVAASPAGRWSIDSDGEMGRSDSSSLSMRTPSTTRRMADVKFRHRSDVTCRSSKPRSSAVGTAMPYLLVCSVCCRIARLPYRVPPSR